MSGNQTVLQGSTVNLPGGASGIPSGQTWQQQQGIHGYAANPSGVTGTPTGAVAPDVPSRPVGPRPTALVRNENYNPAYPWASSRVIRAGANRFPAPTNQWGSTSRSLLATAYRQEMSGQSEFIKALYNIGDPLSQTVPGGGGGGGGGADQYNPFLGLTNWRI